MNLVTGMYYSMDGPAGLIWSMIHQCCTVKDVVDAVVARYAISHQQAYADVVQLLEALRQEELIVQAAQGPATVDVPAAATPHAYVQPQLRTFNATHFKANY